MLSNLSPLLANVSTTIKPEDLLLSQGSWIRFSERHKKSWCRGKLFEVVEEPILVNYPVSYTLPGDDYKDLDLSNSTSGLKLYPEDEFVLYQIGVGLKVGDYIVHVYIPGVESYIYRLDEQTIYPDITSATLKYLGAFDPESSPFNAPLLYMYVFKDVDAFFLRPYILEGCDFEKVTIGFRINKCKLRELTEFTEEEYNLMMKKSFFIPYYEEFKGH